MIVAGFEFTIHPTLDLISFFAQRFAGLHAGISNRSPCPITIEPDPD